MDLQRFDIDLLRRQFAAAEPFSHLIIDNFFDESYLNNVLTEIQQYPPEMWFDKNNAAINNESDNIFQNKKIALTDYNKFGSCSASLIDFTKSPEFIQFLVSVTGINDLESDPHLYGGGIHKVSNGGRLSIHSDFNIHPLTSQHRRLNVLLYLNKDWQPSYNGQLELWDKNMTQMVSSIAPIFNRLVVFRITDDAFHGHPEPWINPNGVPRLSFALYYYTRERPEAEKSGFHWALWQQRPRIGF